MTDAVKTVLLDLGVPASLIRTEAFGRGRRDPAKKLGKSGRVAGKGRFLNSGRSASVREGATLLDVAGEAKVGIDSACRSGTCGTFMVKPRAGNVRMSVQDALSGGDREDGYILASQAEPEGDGELKAQLRAARLDQRLSGLDHQQTMVENFAHFDPEEDANGCRAALARFQFRSAAADRPVAGLSGGRQVRAALACVLVLLDVAVSDRS